MGRTFIGLACLVFGISFSAAASQQMTADEWGELGNELLVTDQKIQGEWSERQKWDGWICDGFYHYKLFLTAGIKDVDFELTDKGYVLVSAEVKDIYARADGGYRSKATMCMPSVGWLGIGITWGRLKSEAHFGEGGEMKDLRLKILSTEIGEIKLGKYAPAWFEKFVTGVANRTLSMVWNSRLGTWLSDKISEVARKKIAERGR